MPSSLLSVVLVPIIKSKAGNVNSIDNYRPVALSSIVSKVFESIILCRIECCLITNANQFGFKRKHGTDMCIYTLKEIVNMYTSLNSCVLLVFWMQARLLTGLIIQYYLTNLQNVASLIIF